MEDKVAVHQGRTKALWLVVYILWIFGDIEFAWGWDSRHLIFLFFFLLGTICVSYAELEHRHAKYLAIAAVTIALVIFVFAPPIVPEETVRRGLLVPANDPMPSTGCDPAGNPRETPGLSFDFGTLQFGLKGLSRPTIVLPKDAAIVAVGSNGVILSVSDKIPIVRVGECTLLSMQKKRDGVLINSSVYDRSNKLIGNIKDNNFQGIENANSHIKQEGDLSTLIIRDESRERLWVRFLNPRAIRVRGEFICPNRSATIVINDRSFSVDWPQPPSFVMENQCSQNGPLMVP